MSAYPVFLMNRDGTIVDANEAAGETFGLSASSLRARDFCEQIISPICQESFRISFERLVATQSGPLAGKRIEISAIRSDRQEVPVELTLKAIHIEDHTQYAAFVRDISDARKTETLMRESEARFRRIFESNMAPMCFWDIHGNITDANDAFLKLLGYARKDLASGKLSWTALFPSSSKQLEKENTEQLLKTGLATTFEFEAMHKEGHLIPVLTSLAIAEGNRERGISVLLSTAQTRESTRVLNETIFMFRELLEKIPNFVFVKDSETRFRYVNGAFGKHHGKLPAELIGKLSHELDFSHADKNRVADKRTLLTGESSTTEFPVAKDGRDYHVRINRYPLRDSKGQINGIIGIGQNLTSELRREEEIRSRLETLKMISEGVTEGITLQDPNGTITFSNSVVHEMLADREHWVTTEGHPLAVADRPDQIVLRGAKEAEALVLVRGVNEERWILQRAIGLRDNSGVTTGILSVYRDLTEVRKLENLNQQQKAAMRASMDALAIHEAHGEFSFVNDAHVALYGYTMNELQGKTWKILYSEEEAKRLDQEALPKLIALGNWRGEALGRKKDGSFFPQEISLTITSNGAIICAIRDLSEKKWHWRARDLLESISQNLRSSLDYRGQLQSITQQIATEEADFCQIDLIDPKSVLSCEAAAYRDSTGPAQIRKSEPLQCAHEAIKSGKPRFVTDEAELTELRSQLGIDVKSCIVAPITARGHALGAITLARSAAPQYNLHNLELIQEIAYRISTAVENSKLYDRAQNALISRDEFIASLSHDLKNPLSAILLNTSFLARMIEKAPDASERELLIREQLRALERTAKRMNQLLTESLDLARLYSGRLILDRREYKIATLLQEVSEDLAPAATAKKVRLESVVNASRLTAHFDRQRIEQVLSTLISNAIRYSPENGSVRVTVQELSHELLFSVTDSGLGLSMNEKKAIFERYSGSDSQRVSQGVSLPFCKGIAEAHGGKLWLDTESGPGSTFRFTIAIQEL
jgi:PAS domain S-box-containing protein